MQTRPFIPWAFAAVLATAAVLLAACSGSNGDKAGGSEDAEPRVLTLASPIGGAAPAPLGAFAEEVSWLSDGTLEVRFEGSWRFGEPLYEAGTLRDVQAGKVDMGWVGSRVFDTVGVTSFQALQAPLLIDSYDLEGKVFEEGLPQSMLEGVSELDLVGIGVLPGPMRKVLGVAKPFVDPDDFEGEIVGFQDSEVANATLRALGSTPMAVPTSAKLEGLDAYEQQLSSIQGNSYDMSADYVTANLNLWPRPYVIVMGKEAFESLTETQQSALREAALAATPYALEWAREEDNEAASALCRRGMSFVSASEGDGSALRQALEPVYAELANDAETKSYLDVISGLKTEIAASAEAPVCEPESGGTTSASALPEGTYETTVTEADWSKHGVPADNTGVFSMTLEDGELTLVDPNGEVGYRATYNVFRDQLEAQGNPDTVTAGWSLDGADLRFTDVASCEGSSCSPAQRAGDPYAVVWGSHPWVRRAPKQDSIDGVYRTSFTREELARSPLLMDSQEVNDENWGDLTLTLDGGLVTFEQENDVSSTSTSGTYELDGETVVLDFTEGVNAGETFAVRWSLFRDQLTLTRDEAVGIIPTPYLIKPWSRAG